MKLTWDLESFLMVSMNKTTMTHPVIHHTRMYHHQITLKMPCQILLILMKKFSMKSMPISCWKTSRNL